MGKNDFKNLIPELDNKVFDLVKQKKFYPYKCMTAFYKFKENLPSK